MWQTVVDGAAGSMGCVKCESNKNQCKTTFSHTHGRASYFLTATWNATEYWTIIPRSLPIASHRRSRPNAALGFWHKVRVKHNKLAWNNLA